MRRAFALFLVVLGLTACSRFSPAPAINESFKVIEPAQPEKGGPAASQPVGSNESKKLDWAKEKSPARFAIFKTALEKEFLLQSQLIDLSEIPTFTGLKSRVVFFKKADGRLFLFESPIGLVSHKDVPAKFLIAEFPIVNETDDEIEFDFAKGMSQIFVAEEWFASDFGGKPRTLALQIPVSFVDKVEFTDHNQIAIHQVAQARVQVRDSMELINIEARYYLSPYKENSKFKPTESPDFKSFGFFEVAPINRLGDDSQLLATKFDISEKVKWYVSANTPTEYRQAVKEGILYWNKAFGSEVVEVADAPDGVSAPDINYNVFQWVDTALMMGAYADAQSDPRTGQIYHSQVFFGSGIVLWANLAHRSENSAAKRPYRRLNLTGFQSSRLCDFEIKSSRAAVSALAEVQDPEQKQRIVNDFIRNIAAHEIGHTFGLRHNFAGSLYTNVHGSERNDLRTRYFSNQLPKDTLVTSSVMDYLHDISEFISGSQVKNELKAHAYDEAAIQKLYFGIESAKTPLFCTDSLADQSIADCLRSDFAGSPVEYLTVHASEENSNLINNILREFVHAKAPIFSTQPISLSKVELDANQFVRNILVNRDLILKPMTRSGALLQIRRKYDSVSDVNFDKVKMAELDFLQTEVNRLGGFEKVFQSFEGDFVNEKMAHLEMVILSRKFDRGTNGNGKSYEFSEADYSVIRAKAKEYFAKIADMLQMAEIKSLLGELEPEFIPIEDAQTDSGFEYLKPDSKEFVNHPLSDSLAAYFEKIAMEYLTQTTGKTIPATFVVKKDDKELKISVELPEFKYDQVIRRKVVALLNPSRSESPYWGLYERGRVTKAFSKIIDDALTENVDLGDLHAYEYDRPVAKWILDQQAVKKSFD